jgi:hypothetical protein
MRTAVGPRRRAVWNLGTKIIDLCCTISKYGALAERALIREVLRRRSTAFQFEQQHAFSGTLVCSIAGRGTEAGTSGSTVAEPLNTP